VKAVLHLLQRHKWIIAAFITFLVLAGALDCGWAACGAVRAAHSFFLRETSGAAKIRNGSPPQFVLIARAGDSVFAMPRLVVNKLAARHLQSNFLFFNRFPIILLRSDSA
jgi:hypothetical protein